MPLHKVILNEKKKQQRNQLLLKLVLQNLIIDQGKNFYILKNGKVVGKVYKLPQHIIIKEITSNFNPVVFFPDGTCKMAGHITFGIENGKNEKTLIIENITGKCLVR